MKSFIHLLYQLGITLYYLGYSLYRFLAKVFHLPLPAPNPWLPPLPLTPTAGSHDTPPLVWIHAVSGGEVKLAEKLIQEFFPPDQLGGELGGLGKVFLTHCSATGRQMAERISQDHPHLIHCHLPIDFYPLTRRWASFIKRQYRLTTYLIIEHDFWPNWLGAMGRIGARRIGVNYFLKKKDFSRYRILPSVYRFVHDLDLLLTQSEEETKKVARFHPGFEVITAGNVKYDWSPNNWSPKSGQTRQPIPANNRGDPRPGRMTITLGSSHPGEEEIFLEALSALSDHFSQSSKPPLRLIIIPRHPERATTLEEPIARWIQRQRPGPNGMDCQFFPPTQKTGKIREPKKAPSPIRGDMVLVREMGWSEHFYQQSDIVIIGDTFIPSQGGHNFLEALQYGKPVIYGPNMVNYSDITPDLEAEGAVIRISRKDTLKNLTAVLNQLINQPERRKAAGKKGLAFLKKIKYDRDAYRQALQSL